MENYAIRITDLKKSFGKVNLFQNLNLSIQDNTITALTGKNGVGKTTLLKILSGLVIADSGKVFINGIDITKNRVEAKKNVGTVFSPEIGFYPQLTVYENLNFFCKIYNVDFDNITFLINQLTIQPFFNVKFNFCSSGIKQRLAIVSALIHRPKILLIDEITKSVDSETSTKIYELVKLLHYEYKMTILFVTHNLDEVKYLAQKHFVIENKTLTTN